jgi:hypothetical protein
VKQDDHIGVLLDGAGFAEVGHAGHAAFVGIDLAVELGDDDDGDVELPG